MTLAVLYAGSKATLAASEAARPSEVSEVAGPSAASGAAGLSADAGAASMGAALPVGEAERLADELTAALRAAGATVVHRGAGDLREIVRQARETGQAVLLCPDDLVAHPSLLWTLATEPARRSTVLVTPADGGDLREDRGRVVAAPPGAGTVRDLGAIYLAPADLPLLERVADRPDPVPALIEAGLVPIATRVRLLHAERAHTVEQLADARRRIAAVDEDKARLRLAVKEQDDFFTTYAVSTWSPYVTKAAARLRLTPSGVTALSVLFAVAAALGFWQASRPAMVAGAILLYLGFVLDCVDGQLARYTRRFEAFGGWLDTMADRAKEYAVYAGLAAGAERAGFEHAWPLAITAILVQTVRHMTDTFYGALHDEAAARPRPQATGGVGAKLSAASTRVQADRGSLAYWLKRIVVFPIGERWALMAVLAAVANGRVALIAVVGWGLLAAAYTLGLRSLRALSMRVGVLDTMDTMRHRDDGPLVRTLLGRKLPAPLAFSGVAALAAAGLVAALLTGALQPGAAAGVWTWGDTRIKLAGPGEATAALVLVALLVLAAGLPARARHDGPLDWLVPAALRAAEYLVVVAVGLACSAPPAVVFLLLFALALRHYDLTARMEKAAPEGAARGALLGWDGRVALLVAAALAGYAVAGAVVLAVLVGGAFLITAIRDWRTPS